MQARTQHRTHPLARLSGSAPRSAMTLAATAALLAMGSVALPAWAQAKSSDTTNAQTSKADTTKPGATQDVLIFRNGNTLTGTIVSMNDKTVRFRSVVSGIPFETDYARDQISDIKRGVPAASAPAAAPEATKPALTPATAALGPAGNAPSASANPATAPKTSDVVIPDDGRTRIYWIDLEGKFGQDISETPLRSAVEDARKNGADVLVIYLNNQWSFNDEDERSEKPDVSQTAEFDELFRAEKMMPALTDEIAAEWDTQPKIIFWVRRAMGGLAFMPLISDQNYFTSDGKLGGVGNLSTMMKDRGHERVVAKQVSLRLQHAVGWARKGGYSEPLVRALTMPEFVLTVKLVNGQPQFFERYPESPDEELLTDDGKEVNADSLEAIVRGEGNDVLTLNARTAKLINLSQGTVDTRDELLAATGYDREGVVIEGRSKKIMKDWSDGLDRAKKQLRTMLEEFREIRVEGDRQQRIRARGSMINKIEQIKGLLRRYLEAWDPQYLNEMGIPLNGEGQANIEALTGQQETLKLQNLGDK